MIEIDGSKGGGQLLRTALTLSVVTGKSFRMKNIRGKRSDPGLKNQHLECVKALKNISNAEVRGLEKYSTEIVFNPGSSVKNNVKSDIGTAGSVNLVLDTLMPLVTIIREPLNAEIVGGTDVKWAPTSLHYEHVKRPILEQIGVKVEYDLENTGFYPSGGGLINVQAENSFDSELDLTNKGALQRVEVFSKASENLSDSEVAERQANKLIKELDDFIEIECDKNTEYVDSESTGSVILLKAVYENSVAGFDCVGEKGKSSEKVALDVFEQFKGFHNSEACVDEFMADQLIVYGVLKGGRFSVPEITSHVESSIDLVDDFGFDVSLDRHESAPVISFDK